MDAYTLVWFIAAILMVATVLVITVVGYRRRYGSAPKSKFAPTGDPTVDAANGARSARPASPSATVTPSTAMPAGAAAAEAPAERWNPQEGRWESAAPTAPAPEGPAASESVPYTPNGTEYRLPTEHVVSPTDPGGPADARRFDITEIPPNVPGEREFIIRDDETGSRVEVAAVFERGRISLMAIRPKYLGQGVEFALFEAAAALLPQITVWAWPPMTGAGREALVGYARSHPAVRFTEYDGSPLI